MVLGQTLDNGIKLLEGDAGIRELLRDYKGLNVIHFYVVENSGLIIAVDALGAEAEGVNEEFGLGAKAEGVNEGVAAINYYRQNLKDFVHPYFKKDTYLRVYNHMINPVLGMHDYEESPLGPVDPPHVVKRVGRPKKERRKDANDIREPTRVSRRGLTHTCAICGKQGNAQAEVDTPLFSQQTAAEIFPNSKMPTPPFSQETAAESFPISEHIPQQMPAYRPQSIPQNVPKNPPRMPASRPPRSQNVTFQMPQHVPQHVPQNVPRPQNVHPQISSTTSSCSQNKVHLL
ncbi:UNVERIFIED_CONTAM: hypothetical protein Scaly_2519800 [Sesamum calycinum]|uniref:Uncharacterized protein n=1 Tax=Sesamum calycinum TaxID=2727403 RepID=A0AAW2LSP0_9LAMI